MENENAIIPVRDLLKLTEKPIFSYNTGNDVVIDTAENDPGPVFIEGKWQNNPNN